MFCFSRVLACPVFLALAFPAWAAHQVSSTAQQTSPAQQPQPTAQQASTTDANPIVHVSPPSPDATAPELEKEGDDLRAQKAYLDSIDYYRASIKKQDSAILHNKIGISLLQLQRENEARKEFLRSIQMDKSYPEPHNNLGALNYNEARYGPAVKEYRKAIHLNEANAAFHSNLGTAYFAEKDWTGAIKEFERAKQLDPSIFERQSSGGVSIRLISSSDLGHFHYMMAQIAGSQNDLDTCRIYLSKANEEGYPIRDALHDDQFAGLRKDPNFVAFVRSLKPPQSSNE